mgnify:CR=1 FL=1
MKVSTDAVFLITGAAGGIAGEIIREFREAGARLALADLPGDRLHARARESGAIAVESDLTRSDDAERAVRETISRYARIDGVIHTTGGFGMVPAPQIDAESYERMFDLNVRTLVLVARAAVPVFVERGSGFLAAFSAAPGFLRGGGAGMSLYAASKAAVAAFVHALSDELRDRGVRTAVVYPMDVVDTPANREAMPDADRSKWIDPAEIGRALLLAATRGSRARISDIPVYPG